MYQKMFIFLFFFLVSKSRLERRVCSPKSWRTLWRGTSEYHRCHLCLTAPWPHTHCSTNRHQLLGAHFKRRLPHNTRSCPQYPLISRPQMWQVARFLWLSVWDIMGRVYDYFLCVPQGRPGRSLTQRPSHHSAPGIHHRGCAKVSTVRLCVLYVVDSLLAASQWGGTLLYR